MSEINELASQIVDSEFGYLTGSDKTCRIASTEAWLLYNIGRLNNRIYTSFSGEDPGLGHEERSIYSTMYLMNYYASEAQKVLRNMSSDTLQWLTLKEADTTVTLQNKNEVAKTYISMSRTIKEDLEKQVAAYNGFLAGPREVGTYNYGTGGRY
jgi:hypothetical protein